MPTVNRAIKYRIHPSEEQGIQIRQTFGCARKIYNAAIELQEGLHAAKMGAMSKIDLNNHINRIMKEDIVIICGKRKTIGEKRTSCPRT